jgi:copper chaperone CopZ
MEKMGRVVAGGVKEHDQRVKVERQKKVERVKLDVKKHLAYIHMLDNKSLTDEEIHKAIKDAGYKTSTIKRGT